MFVSSFSKRVLKDRDGGINEFGANRCLINKRSCRWCLLQIDGNSTKTKTKITNKSTYLFVFSSRHVFTHCGPNFETLTHIIKNDHLTLI